MPSPRRSPKTTKPRAALPPSQVILDRYLPYQLRLLSEAYSLGLARMLQRRFDLALREWRILFHIGAEEPMSVTQISIRSVMDKGSVSRGVAILMDRGYVTRRNRQKKARRADLYLSAKGRRAYEEIMPLLLAREARLLSPLDEAERKQLLRAIKMLLGQVWAANAGGIDLDLGEDGA
ncbi:MAG TPA: MarR family winged helix-turn-helix transcriptional regulator [Alphaproteobacteria bacterium]|nr:MarR family winged helix-turn-helix transcriptional regulator [Alphaproteobacteria bacterium]